MPFPSPSFASEFGKTPELQVSKKEFAALYAQFQTFLAVSHDSDGNILSVDNILDFQEWTDIPYNAAMFNGTGGGTWTISPSSLVRFAYRLIGSSMRVHFTVSNVASITVAPVDSLQISLPSTYVSAETISTAGWYADNVTPGFQPILVSANKTSPTISVILASITQMPVTANQIIYAAIEFQFNRVGV